MYYEPVTPPCQLPPYIPNSDEYACVDRVINGRRKSLGNKVGATKLTAEKANELRLRTTESHAKLAKEYGISEALVSLVQANKRWINQERN